MQILPLIGGQMTLERCNITYGHHIYDDGYRYKGRPIGHWADQDSQILSFGGVLQKENGIGWGSTIRTGNLNEDGSRRSSVSNGVPPIISPSMFSILGNILNMVFQFTSFGWESLETIGRQDR